MTSVLVLAAFAGCISKGDEAPQTQEQINETSNGVIDANESTAAPDGRGDLAAFKETNRTEASGTGAMEHKHDYWKGETRKWVWTIPVSLIPFPLTPCKEAGTCTVGGGGETYPAGTAIADFDLEEGLIFEGTTAVELLPEFINAPAGLAHPTARVFFDYLTAADEPGKFRTGGELKVGEPFVLDIEPTDADMPHQAKSLWIFRIYSDSTTGLFEMDLNITAVKGEEVVDWPPHPDLYAERSERTIFDGPVHMESKGTLDSNIYGSDAGWVNPERIISWGTQRVEVTVTSPTFESQIPVVTPTGFVLEYHNATKPPLLGHGAQYGGRLVDEGSDGSTYHFVIDVSKDHESYDTPYGTKSRWGFRFVPQFDTGGAACLDDSFLQQFLVGCQFVPWSMDYTMTIKAYGVSAGDPLAGQEAA